MHLVVCGFVLLGGCSSGIGPLETSDRGGRFEGLLPPVVMAPAFAIRKPAVAVFTLDDYVAKGIMTSGEAGALKDAVAARHNILVAGGA